MLKSKFILTISLLVFLLSPARAQKLFNDNECKALGTTFSAYIENTVDTLSKMTEQAAFQLSTKKNFYLFVDGKEGTSAHAAAKQLYSLKSGKYKLYMSKSDKLISCRWAFTNGREIKVQAEISREAVEGTDKEHADKLVMASLQTLPKSNYTLALPQEKELRHVSATSLLVKDGKSYRLKTVNANTYYNKERGQLKAAFDKRFPVESLHNLAQNAIEKNDYRLEIEQNIYNAVSEPVSVSLKDLISYWQLKRCFNIYSGVSREEGKEDYDIIVIAEHKDLQYIHLLKFSFNEKMFNTPNVSIKASLTPNIPQQNLKSLF